MQKGLLNHRNFNEANSVAYETPKTTPTETYLGYFGRDLYDAFELLEIEKRGTQRGMLQNGEEKANKS